MHVEVLLPREEYVEQAYFFRVLRERMQQSTSTQELLDAIRQEILATTMLPFAMEFWRASCKLTGGFARAMARRPITSRRFRATWWPRPRRPRGASISALPWRFSSARRSIGRKGPRRRGLPLPVRGPLPQSPGLRPRARGRGRRPDLRRAAGGSGSSRSAARSAWSISPT